MTLDDRKLEETDTLRNIKIEKLEKEEKLVQEYRKIEHYKVDVKDDRKVHEIFEGWKTRYNFDELAFTNYAFESKDKKSVKNIESLVSPSPDWFSSGPGFFSLETVFPALPNVSYSTHITGPMKLFCFVYSFRIKKYNNMLTRIQNGTIKFSCILSQRGCHRVLCMWPSVTQNNKIAALQK